MNDQLRRSTVVISALAVTVLLTVSCFADDDRLWEALDLSPGLIVADVGAGEGQYSARLGSRIGTAGHLFSTEVDDEKLSKIHKRLSDDSEAPFTVVLGGDQNTGLPHGCCDRILLRLVYHHFTDPSDMIASLHRSLKPGGLLVLVDFEPGRLREVRGVPESRGGHGIRPELAIEELTASGFELVEHFKDWEGKSERFCLVLKAVSR